MKDHVESYHLTKFDVLRGNRDQVMDLETWFQIHNNVSSVETASPKPKYFISFVTTVKSHHSPSI